MRELNEVVARWHHVWTDSSRHCVIMGFTREYSAAEPRRAEVDKMPGPLVLEFGNSWCGYCRRAEPLIENALATHASVPHLRIADASARRLGRSFGVKLWPTFVFVKDGREVARLVRPGNVEQIGKALAAIDPV